jgi:hypothetical protein
MAFIQVIPVTSTNWTQLVPSFPTKLLPSLQITLLNLAVDLGSIVVETGDLNSVTSAQLLFWRKLKELGKNNGTQCGTE